MIRWLINRRIRAFEKAHGYDMDYARDILDADLGLFARFAIVSGLAQYRRSVPREAWYAAKLVATVAEDCGPCTQLAVMTQAEHEGVAPHVLNAILARDMRALPAEVALSLRFAQAVLSHDPAAEELRGEIIKRWGQRGLMSLAMAITTARMFPTIKYALGRGQACTRVNVGGAMAHVRRHAA